MMIRVWSGTEKSGLSTLTNIPSETFIITSYLIFIKTRNKNIQEIYIAYCLVTDVIFFSFLKRKGVKSVDQSKS